jgi:hypothetical protein
MWAASKTHMAKHQSKSQPTWAAAKAKLAAFDRAALLKLIHHLYAAHKDNQAFLHARFGLGQDVLEPYKKNIDRWPWPDVFRHQETSVSRAKQAISDYKKAVGDLEGLTELMVFYCEQAAGFCRDIGQQDEGYFGSARQSVRVFVLRGFLETHILVLCGRQRQHSHQNGQNSEFAVEMTLGRTDSGILAEDCCRPTELGNQHQTRVPTFPQRRRRAADSDNDQPH